MDNQASLSSFNSMRLSRKLLLASFVASAATFSFIGTPSEACAYGSNCNTTSNNTTNNNTVNNNQSYGSTDSPVDPGSFSLGMDAPTADVGTDSISKGTVTFSTSVGQSDQFAVGTSSAVSASANIAATPDYDASATANFDIGANTKIQQTIGQGVDVGAGLIGGVGSIGGSTIAGIGTGSAFSANQGQIGGTFTKIEAPTVGEATSNEVTVDGIGSNAQIAISKDKGLFTTSIEKDETPADGITAGTASGSASGAVNTSTSASASSSQFVSSFVQAY